MKKLFLFAISSLATQLSFGQYNSAWNVTTLNYNVGIGTKNTTSNNNLPTPNFNLHLHGTADLIENDRFGISVNYGKATRLGFTNTVTGMTANDGTVMRMVQNNFSIENRESGSLSIGAQNITLLLSNNRFWIGTTSNLAHTDQARMNILPPSSENGLFIQTSGSNYGLRLKASLNSASVLQVVGSDNSRNFAVDGFGNAYARKYTTTLGAIPDYVFDPSYKLMSLNELKTYITTNKHLPNIPSAKEYEERGELDLGELNRKLLEKVEELTLYILQLEERMKTLENK